MPRIDELPADRRAVLQLLLKQGKTYDELSSLLRIEPDHVRERARDALDRLGPGDGAGLALERQDELSDFLLGQQSAADRAETRRLLEESAGARAWARVVAGELLEGGVASADALPEIPADRAEAPTRAQAAPVRQREPRQPRERRPPREPRAPREPRPPREPGAERRSSRMGGLLLLAAVGAAIAILIIVVIPGGDDDNAGTSAQRARTQTTGQPQVLGQINLNPPEGSGSEALAALTLVRQGDETDILFQGQGIPPNKTGDVYALWVRGSRGVARLGFMPRVGKTGKVRFPGALPNSVNLANFDTLLMTRETTASPTKPGPIVLQGTLPGA